MRKILYFISWLLEILCTLQHKLPIDAYIQKKAIKHIGYHCPLAMWSHMLDDKYKLGVWKQCQR